MGSGQEGSQTRTVITIPCFTLWQRLYSGSLDTGKYNMLITATAAESVSVFSTVTLLSRSSTKMQSQYLEYTNSFFGLFFF